MDDTGNTLYEIPVNPDAWPAVAVSDDFTWLVTYYRAQAPHLRFYRVE